MPRSSATPKPLSQAVLSKYPHDRYISIQEAGRSFVGDSAVFLSIPRYLLISLNNPLSAECIKSLRAGLVVVKLVGNDEKSDQEVNNLKLIQATNATGRYAGIHSRFPVVGPYDDLWFELSALEPSLTLSFFINSIKKNSNSLPSEFVAHVFLELLSPIEFSHTDCRLTHGDLHSGKIMFDLRRCQNDAPKTLPNLVLIDFGVSVPFDEEGGLEDVRMFCSVFSELSKMKCVDESSTWNISKFLSFCGDVAEMRMVSPADWLI